MPRDTYDLSYVVLRGKGIVEENAIGVYMNVDSVATCNITERCCIRDEHQWAQHRSLRDSKSHSLFLRYRVVRMNVLSTVFHVGFEPCR